MRNYINKILLCMVFLIGIVATAAADNLYVITDGNGNYLANNGGTLTNATTFNPKTCMWTCSGTSSGTLSNQGHYLYGDRSSLSLKTSSSDGTSWTISNNRVYTTPLFSTYYITYNNSKWTTSRSGGASIYSTTLKQTAKSGTVTVEYDNTQTFEREGDTRDYYVSAVSYTPAYNTYTWTESGGTKTWYASSDDSYASETAPSEVTTVSAYEWTSSHSNISVTKDNEHPEQATASYDTKFSSETTVTITATATIPQSASEFMTSDATMSGTVTATLLPRHLTDIQISASTTALYIGDTGSLTVTTNSNGAVTYTSSDTSIAEVSTDGVITAKGTGNKNAAEVQITVSTSQTDDYEAASATLTIEVRKRPAKIDLQYDKSSLTYGEAVPVLTSSTLTDGISGEEINKGKISFSSSVTHIQADASTGAITVDKAGIATITATFSGNKTYAKAEATFDITVSKAATTLSFPETDYFVLYTQGFTAPAATLTPTDAGTVSYSCVSTPEGAVTIDGSTGAVTLNAMEAEATVTASFAGNDCYEPSEASYKLTVSTRAIPTITATVPSSLYVDDSRTVRASTNSSAGIVYSCDDTDVLTIDEAGKMTTVGEGKAVVKITSTEDDDYITLTKEYTVEVKRYPTELMVTYPYDIYHTDYEGQIMPSVTLRETVNNSLIGQNELGGEVTYSAVPSTVLTVDDLTGEVTITGNGTAVITASYEGNHKYEPSSGTFVMQTHKVAGPGSFIRLKDPDGNYLNTNGTTVSVTADEDASSIIWYGKDRSLLFYQCGLYLKDTSPALMSPIDVGESGNSFSLTRTGHVYTVSDGTGSLTSGSNNEWTVEFVEYLPLTFKSAGYGFSTIYCPCNLSSPAGVVAYYPTDRNADDTGAADFVITLKSMPGNFIPHGTPTVLHTQYVGTYNFHIIEEDVYDITDRWDGLAGTLPTLNTASAYSGTQCPYTLQPDKSESAGFYPWSSQRHTTIEPFRCYIPGENAANARSFRFDMEDNGTDTINSTADDDASDDKVYNLQGMYMGDGLQRLSAGVYVRGGKKVVKK